MSLKGFEPPTHGLEGRCSIQLSYRLKSGWWESNPRIQLGRLVFYHWTTPAYLIIHKSGWQDSNLRPPGPKPGALAKLSHTPKDNLQCFSPLEKLCFVSQSVTQELLYKSAKKMSTLFLHFFQLFSNCPNPWFFEVFAPINTQFQTLPLLFYQDP